MTFEDAEAVPGKAFLPHKLVASTFAPDSDAAGYLRHDLLLCSRQALSSEHHWEKEAESWSRSSEPCRAQPKDCRMKLIALLIGKADMSQQALLVCVGAMTKEASPRVV